MLKFDKNKTDDKGRFLPPFSVLERKMIEKYLIENGLDSAFDEDCLDYLRRCVDKHDEMRGSLQWEIEAFQKEAELIGEEFEKAKNELFSYWKGIASLVERFGEHLKSEGIWSRASESDAAKNLRTFYAFSSAVERCVAEKKTSFEYEKFNLLFEKELEAERHLTLFEISCQILEEEEKFFINEMADRVKKASKAVLYNAGECEKLFFRINENDRLLGSYLTTVSAALATDKNGELPQISAVRNQTSVFLLNYKCEL